MTIAAGNRSWTVQTDASLPEAYRHYRYLITTVDTDQEAETGMIIARLSDGMPEETARLLAAAPLLLEALQEIIHHVNYNARGCGTAGAILDCYRAIEAATGENLTDLAPEGWLERAQAEPSRLNGGIQAAD